jgi:7,8-dihydropterin-6-yl-methyl-4-(beta-D-ribofuranosyl)aminobenzene 5'-phosphate synthase
MERRIFVKTLVLGSGTMIFGDHDVGAVKVDSNGILVKMIYNNTGQNHDYKKEWGLAIWIEQDNRAVLFDTGGNPGTLLKNMQTAGLDTAKISVIIISHNHWDHTRGLPAVLENLTKNTTVYVPASDAPEIPDSKGRVTVKQVSAAQQLDGSIWSTGEMKGSLANEVVYEQSVILLQKKLLYVFTGCAHPGIVAIVEKTGVLYPDHEIALVAGGFHLIDKSAEEIKILSGRLNDLNVKRIAPSHCTGDKAIDYFRAEWKDRFVDLNIGDDFNI